MPCDSLYTTIEAPAKLLISAIFGRFRGLEPTICGPERISMHCDPRYTTIEASAKIVISAIFAVFMGYNPRFMVSGGFRYLVTPFTRLSRHRQNS